jgi:hypothetical protein
MFLDAVVNRENNNVVFNASVADTCRFVLHMNPSEDDTVYVVEGSTLTIFTPLEYLQHHKLERSKLFTLDEVIARLKETLVPARSFKRELDNGGYEIVRSMRDGYRFEHTVAGVDFGGFAELDISVIDEERWGTKFWEEA